MISWKKYSSLMFTQCQIVTISYCLIHATHVEFYRSNDMLKISKSDKVGEKKTGRGNGRGGCRDRESQRAKEIAAKRMM